MFRQIIKLAGFNVREAGDGPDALRIIAEEPPDLVVLDLALPTLDGLSVHSEIAAHPHTRHIPIVVVTGSTIDVPGLVVECLLRKPVSPDQLIRAIRGCLRTSAYGVQRH
jgi:diguanylate cyclase